MRCVARCGGGASVTQEFTMWGGEWCPDAGHGWVGSRAQVLDVFEVPWWMVADDDRLGGVWGLGVAPVTLSR
jgi:hypothetical protein